MKPKSASFNHSNFFIFYFVFLVNTVSSVIDRSVAYSSNDMERRQKLRVSFICCKIGGCVNVVHIAGSEHHVWLKSCCRCYCIFVRHTLSKGNLSYSTK